VISFTDKKLLFNATIGALLALLFIVEFRVM
jgi:hypothetical protein